MKKAIIYFSPLLVLFVIAFLLESCTKDPVKIARSDLYKKLKGTWVLTDYSAYEGGGWSVSGDYFWDRCYYTFSDNVVLCTIFHAEQTWPNDPIRDTTYRSYSYFKQLSFAKYKKNLLYYSESTTNSGLSTKIDNSVDWTGLMTDELNIIIEDNNCGILIDEADNLVITYNYDYSHVSGGESSDKRWVFRKE
jgi:hypothetical protein